MKPLSAWLRSTVVNSKPPLGMALGVHTWQVPVSMSHKRLSQLLQGVRSRRQREVCARQCWACSMTADGPACVLVPLPVRESPALTCLSSRRHPRQRRRERCSGTCWYPAGGSGLQCMGWQNQYWRGGNGCAAAGWKNTQPVQPPVPAPSPQTPVSAPSCRRSALSNTCVVNGAQRSACLCHSYIPC